MYDSAMTSYKSPKRKRDEYDYQHRPRVAEISPSLARTRHQIPAADSEELSAGRIILGDSDKGDAPRPENESGSPSKGRGVKYAQRDEADYSSRSPTPPLTRPLVFGFSPKQPPRGKQKRRKSPPLTADPGENPLTWHDSEITGHDPTDPTDDGYGINGIGFRPTAAMAWDRVQRRKRQVEEYKKREAREARDRRRSRRDGLLPEDDEIRSPSSKKKVTFLTQNEQDDNEAEADDAAR